MSRIFQQQCRVTVDGFAVESLRVGFTIERDLTPKPNPAEVSIYNLARGTREKLHGREGVPVVVEAGYEGSRLTVCFAGDMREAFSTPQDDGSWVTVLRAGDGDKARKARGAHGQRPGVDIDRVVSDLAKDLGVGIGNVATEVKALLKSGDVSAEGLGTVLAKGFSGGGATSAQFDKVMRSLNLEWSVQDNELQAIKAGQVVGTTAVFLSEGTGLQGSPSVDAKGVMQCTARLVPGLIPGHPLQVESVVLKSLGVGVWRIEKVRYTGDTYGRDWSAQLTCREVKPR